MEKPAYYKLLLFFKNDKASIRELEAISGLSVSSIKKYLNALQSRGYVRRIDYTSDLFELTEKGRLLRNTLENLLKLDEENIPEYVVTDPYTGTPVNLKIKSFEQLLALIDYKLVDESVLEEHLKRKYLIEWFRNALGDKYIAYLVEKGEINSLEDLKREIAKIIKILKSLRYSVEKNE